MRDNEEANEEKWDLDLAHFIFRKVYDYMDDDDKESWCMEEAEKVAHDFAKDGIVVEASLIYEMVSVFIEEAADDEEEEEV